MTKATTVDEYFAQLTPDVRGKMVQLRQIIQSTAPHATEKISYGMPTFYYHGNLVHYAAFKNHIGFYATPSGHAAFDDELSKYKQGKGSVQFPLDEPLPLDLIRKIVAFRVSEMEQHKATKQKKSTKFTKIEVKTIVQAPLAIVWEKFTTPSDIEKWNAATPDWHCPKAENELQKGGKFKFTMAARDGSFSFDFEGVYDEIIPLKSIEYTLLDGRRVQVQFLPKGENATLIKEVFDAENIHSIEMQRAGWQAILDNFGKYAAQKSE